MLRVRYLNRGLVLWSGVLLLGIALPAEAHNGAMAIAVPVEGIKVDGDLSDWPEGMRRYPIALPEYGVRPRDGEDYQGSFRLGYNAQENALYVAVEVQDESIVVDTTTAANWNTQDGCEVYVDAVHKEVDSPAVQYVLWGNQRGVHGSSSGASMDVEVVARREGTVQRYEWRLDVDRVSKGQMHLRSGIVLGVDVVVGDKDEDGSFSWMTWGLGVSKGIYTDRRGDVLLVESEAALGGIVGKVTHQEDDRPWPEVMILVDDRKGSTRVRAMTDEEGHYRLPMKPGVYWVSVENATGSDPVEVVVEERKRVWDVDFSPKVVVPSAAAIVQLLPDDFQMANALVIDWQWKYQAGDNPEWAHPEFDDRSWPTPELSYWTTRGLNWSRTRRGVLPADNWRGVGWFRIHLAVDSTLWNTALLLNVVYQAGAAEIYFDGKQVYTAGKIGPSKAEEDTRGDRPPQIIPLDTRPVHVLAVRYSNFSVPADQYGGFDIRLRIAGTGITELVSEERKRGVSRGYQMLFTATPLVISLLHLILFIFYPVSRKNLYYALFTFLLGVVAFTGFQIGLNPIVSPEPQSKSLGGGIESTTQYLIPVADLRYPFVTVLGVSFVLLPLFGLRFLYALFYPRVPQLFWIVTVGCGIGYVLSTGSFGESVAVKVIAIICGIIVLASYVEMLRTVVVAIVKKKEGAWIIGIGFTGFVLAIAYSIIGPPSSALLPLLFGVMSPIVSMSIYLARSVARTSRNLEVQLIQVEELSAKNLEQERALRAEAEKELQTAHEMQMALMPKAPPQIQGFEITGRCMPANHVGGDLFQYFHQHDRLSISLADVTGHAMEAAIPVVMFSGILKSQVGMGGTVEELFGKLNQALHGTLTGHTLVCLAMGQLDLSTRRLRFSNAGCPYPYHYRAASGEVVELRMDAYPLGVRLDTTYRGAEVQLEPGDRVVFCSDGIAEAGNAAGEMFGFERTAEAIRRGGVEDLSAEALLVRIIQEVKAFSGEVPQGDDQTVVVLKVEK